METRARYVLIGAFMLAAMAAVFAFVYWLENSGGFSKQAAYRIRFSTPVYGLYTGSSVLYNGVQSGQVTGLVLDPKDPKQVTVDFSLDASIPLHADTGISVSQQGLTGSTVVALRGGSPDSPVLKTTPGHVAELVAPADAGEDVMTAARNAFQSAQDILSENRKNLKSMIGNLDIFSKALARNSSKLDGLISGLESLTGAGPSGPKVAIFGLRAANDFPPGKSEANWLLQVQEPQAALSSGADKMIKIAADGQRSDLQDGQWTDNLTALFQEAEIQSFENAGYLEQVNRPSDSGQGGYQLQTDIRRFAVQTGKTPTAVVDFVAKIVDADGKIVGAKQFEASQPLTGTDAKTVAHGLDATFRSLLVKLVPWAAETLNKAPKPAPDQGDQGMGSQDMGGQGMDSQGMGDQSGGQ